MTDEFSPVAAFLRKPSLVDYPGQIAAVFFLSGCNFNCGFCHNAALLRRPKETLRWEAIERTCRNFLDEWVNAAVITGGEPTFSPELPHLVRLLKGFGLKIKLDTNGSHPAMLAQLLPNLDYIAMDVKCSLARYPEITGYAKTADITTSIALLRDHAADYEFRTTIIQSIHTNDEMQGLKELIHGAKRYVLQPFVPRIDLPDDRFRREARTSLERLDEIRELLRGSAWQIIVAGDSPSLAKNS
jgi:pyruvate formate lyase activating enzyme